MKIMNLNCSRFVCYSFKLMVNHIESMIEVKFENKSFIYYYYTRQDSMLILTESCNLSKKCKKKTNVMHEFCCYLVLHTIRVYL